MATISAFVWASIDRARIAFAIRVCISGSCEIRSVIKPTSFIFGIEPKYSPVAVKKTLPERDAQRQKIRGESAVLAQKVNPFGKAFYTAPVRAIPKELLGSIDAGGQMALSSRDTGLFSFEKKHKAIIG